MNPIKLENMVSKELDKMRMAGEVVEDKLPAKKFTWAMDWVLELIEQGGFIFHKDVVSTDEVALFLAFMFDGASYHTQAGKLLAELERMGVVRKLAIWDVGLNKRKSYVWAVRRFEWWCDGVGRVPKSEWSSFPKPNTTDANIRKHLICAELTRLKK
jgi:hypothetical protein